MAGNTIGKIFTVTTSGESHGPGMSAIIDGCPPGMNLSEDDIQQDLERRRPGTSRFTSQRKEPDQVKIMSGVFEGKTTGTPINLVIKNVDQKSKDYSAIKDKFRPGHADYSYYHKYGIRDYRGGGRSSARETVMRVAAGAIAKKYLKERLGMNIFGYLSQLGPIISELKDKNFIYTNPFFSGDPDTIDELEKFSTDAFLQSAMRDQSGGQIAIAYTVWSKKKGGGKLIVKEVFKKIKKSNHLNRLVTLSPLTEMATNFHKKNGAKLLQINQNTQNFEYKII